MPWAGIGRAFGAADYRLRNRALPWANKECAIGAAGEATALVVEAANLAAQLADGPVAANALDLIEAALGVVG